MEGEFENRKIELVNIDSLSIEEIVFILKDKPNPITRSLLNIVKKQCI